MSLRERKVKKKKRRAVLPVIFVTCLVLMAAGLSFLILILSRAPELDIIDAQPDGYRTSVLDTDGNVVLTLSGQESNRVYVKLSEVPEDLQHAFVAIEDARFYTHHGIDVKGIARAVVQGIRHGRFSEGASTITQQLLKNNVFTDWTREETFIDKAERKIQEQYLAIVLETKVSKDWILENYLNTINLGGGNWGVQTAAKYYFNKDVSELTLSESAVIAGITKNPTSYNPLKNPDKNAERRNKVLKNMLEQAYISEIQYDEAMADPVYERIAEAHSNGSQAEIFNYFEDVLINQALADIMAVQNCSEAEAWNLIYRGGLTIYATEDSALQSLAEAEANKAEYGSPEAQVALVLIDNATGEVRAIVGGRGEKTASLIYNRALSSIRQPGSSIKIIGEYAAGLENHTLTLGSSLDDAPYTYSDGSAVHNADGTYGGMTTVRQAIVKSDNIVAVKCLQMLGVDAVYDSIGNFGISTLDDSDKVEALALGGTHNGVTALEMTAAYSAIARGGLYIEPIYYTKILDHDGHVLIEKKGASHRAVSAETAELLTLAMEDVMTQGTGVDANVEGMALAGKSGTTTGAVDSWFLGFSSNYTLGIWGGYDDNRQQSDVGYTKLIWKGVMSGADAAGTLSVSDPNVSLESAEICTKCGKLAVDGLCDETLQGDMIRQEYYVPGTEPAEKCDCHVKITVCSESGMKAGIYCPTADKVTKVYLKKASAGTADDGYQMPSGLDEKFCTTHTHIWSSFFDKKDDKSDNPDDTEGRDDASSDDSENGDGDDLPGGDDDTSKGNNWWDDIWNSLIGGDG